jgi:hypothetical protein
MDGIERKMILLRLFARERCTNSDRREMEARDTNRRFVTMEITLMTTAQSFSNVYQPSVVNTRYIELIKLILVVVVAFLRSFLDLQSVHTLSS